MGTGRSGLYHGTSGSPQLTTANVQSTPDFYGGVGHTPLPSKYSHWIGVNQREKYINKAKNPALRKAIGELYRPSSYIGDGGTSSIIKFEKATGLRMGRNGNDHTQKGRDMIRHIRKKVLTQNLSPSDRKLALNMLKKLIKALAL